MTPDSLFRSPALLSGALRHDRRSAVFHHWLILQGFAPLAIGYRRSGAKRGEREAKAADRVQPTSLVVTGRIG
jgi:hypothetical protein